MKIRAELHAFALGKIREINIPEWGNPQEAESLKSQQGLLDLAFKYGQNDFQKTTPPLPSLSVGDVVILPDGSRWLIKPIGFAPAKRMAYAPVNSEKGGWTLGLVEEGEPGYYPCAQVEPHSDRDVMADKADQINAGLGLSEPEASKIIVSSWKGKPKPAGINFQFN